MFRQATYDINYCVISPSVFEKIPTQHDACRWRITQLIIVLVDSFKIFCAAPLKNKNYRASKYRLVLRSGK